MTTNSASMPTTTAGALDVSLCQPRHAGVVCMGASIVLSPYPPSISMRAVCLLAGLCLLALPLTPARAQKDALARSVHKRADESWEMAKKIWGWAEPGYQEKKSAALLADTLEKAGFKVQRGVAKIPTAFTATVGSGSPVIGILGE